MNRTLQARAEKDLQKRLSDETLRHSQLAMSAAKRMPRARKKERVGRVVCHHLLQMLASDTPVAVNQSDFELAAVDASRLRSSNDLKDHLSLVPAQSGSNSEQQYSLSI